MHRHQLLIAIAATGCVSTDSPQSGASIRDSAGVGVVESRSPLWSGGEAWRVDTVPLLVIGSVDGAHETQFTDVRGLVRLDGDRIVVADGRTRELRCFSASGEHLWTAGRSGQGPGDFQQLSSIFPYRGDSIIAFDFGLQRYSVFSGAGRYGRSWTPEVPDEADFYRNLVPEGSWPDGSMAIRHSAVRRGVSPPQVTRKPIRLYRYSADGRLLSRIGEFAGAEWYEGEGFGIRPLPHGRGTRFALLPAGLLVGTDDTWEIRQLAMDGRVTGIIRHLVSPQPIMDAVADMEREQLRAVRRSERSRSYRGMPDSILSALTASEERMYDEMPFPLTYPAFGRFLVAKDSSIWVEEYRSPSDSSGAARWTAHDREGRWLGVVSLPARFTPYIIEGDRLVGVQRNTLDVETVVVLRILR